MEGAVEVLAVNDLKRELMFYIIPNFLIKTPSGAFE
jgi:hypothetical protein